MAISVNDIINQAFTRCGLVGDGQSVNGNKATSGLHELRDLISILNTQEYIADNIRIFDVSAKDSITIGDSAKYDIQISKVPNTIKSVGRKVGNRYIQLVKSNFEAVYGSPKSHLSNQYTYNVEFDKEQNTLKGTITFDSSTKSNYKVLFIDDINEIDLSSTLNLQDMYKSLLLSGLAYRLAIRYKLTDWLAVFKEDFEDQKSLIKRVNSNNRPIVWNQIDGSYMDDFINGHFGGGW